MDSIQQIDNKKKKQKNPDIESESEQEWLKKNSHDKRTKKSVGNLEQNTEEKKTPIPNAAKKKKEMKKRKKGKKHEPAQSRLNPLLILPLCFFSTGIKASSSRTFLVSPPFKCYQ